MSNLALTNVINVSVSSPNAGIGEYNTSNLALFTRETPAASFGNLGFNIYLSPTQVGIDFGTGSTTFAMANAVFSQQPNILANGGYLVVIPMLTAAQTAVQHVAFSAAPASGAFELSYSGTASASLAYNASASAVQTALRAISGLASVTVTGDTTAGLDITFTGVSGPAALLTVPVNTIADASSGAITVTPSTTTIGSSAETLDAAINRTLGLVQYFGVITTEECTQTVQLAAAAVIQALNKIAFFVSHSAADVATGGMLDLLRSGGFTQSRGLFYGDTSATALAMMAAYAGRALSTIFDGSNTTQTMHLKDLKGVQPDPSMTQVLLNLCKAAGADVYVSLQGVPKVFTSGKNAFFDDVYNLQWLIGAIQVAGFNMLAQSSTKIAQTEDGVRSLKAAYRQVCEQAVTNQYCAPGSWDSATTFGNQADLLSNISQRGYYIYSAPVSQQSAAARASRAAPVIQIALKQAGAIHSSSVIVNINA